ncbi:MAG: D-alanyl-D-alanine carboxypeptidase/D-alanyl-D-alanine-endopeptidase, partial [Bdellovibrionaceae bacterium]|nr:D-alanyl-D-alanine carboxypeptidase/D-alanyl-D-alanine-endopeptidase [Pseudobdellovibrionaceae bacterium]
MRKFALHSVSTRTALAVLGFVLVASGFLITPMAALAREKGPSSRAIDANAAVHARLKQLAERSGFEAKHLGLWVGDKSESGQEIIFSQNGETQFIPASLSKLVTAAAIFHTLHPGYKYKTQLVSDAKLKDGGALAGSLYLKGGGDPSFVSENMWFLVNELTRTGIVTVEGDIVVDDSRFDSIRIGQDRENTRVDRAYDAPIGAMSMNWNSVNVFVRPGAKAGEPARVILDPDTPYLRLVNDATTSAAGKGKSIAVERTSKEGFEGDMIRVTGKISADTNELVFFKSISHPDL